MAWAIRTKPKIRNSTDMIVALFSGQPTLPSVENLVRAIPEKDRDQNRERHAYDGDDDVDGDRATRWPLERSTEAMVAAAATAMTTFFGFPAPSATPAPSDFPGRNAAMPSIHFGVAPSSPAQGGPRNSRTAATTRYTPSTSFSTVTHVEWPEPGARFTASAMAKHATKPSGRP